MTTALEGYEGSASRLGHSLPPEKTRYPLYRRLGGPQGRSGQMRKISPPPGFDPRTIQPVASRYTDWATRPTFDKRLGGGPYLSSDALLNPNFIASHVRVTREQIIVKSAQVSCRDLFYILLHHFPGGTEVRHGSFSGWSFFWLRLEPQDRPRNSCK